MRLTSTELRDFQKLTMWLYDFDQALMGQDNRRLQHMADHFDETFDEVVRVAYGILTRDHPRRLPRSLARAPSREQLLRSFDDMAELD